MRILTKTFLVAGFVLFVAGIGGVIFIKSQGIREDAAYLGSAQCRRCHVEEYAEWHASLHRKMMRRVDEPGAVVADLDIGSGVPFDPEAAVWVIGSKWEQQFMGERDGQEVLLPGAWLVAAGKWKRKGWDGWQVPVPLRRCHGCHTVGLDLESGKFVEPGIGCESCHGPGSWHVETFGLGRIYSGADAQVCGQCHTRGRSPDGQYFFPAHYRPGQRLDDHFKELGPYGDQNSSQWWGNGHARKRHEEYFAWRQGGHADSLRSLTVGYDGRYGAIGPGCLSCHAGEAAADGLSDEYSLDEVRLGIGCAVCHHAHGALDRPRLVCSDCHGEGAFYHRPEDNIRHIPCPDGAAVKCVNCHMPLTGRNGGGYTLHSHSAGIVPPADTRRFGVPNSCANGGCHQDKDLDWLEGAYQAHYR